MALAVIEDAHSRSVALARRLGFAEVQRGAGNRLFVATANGGRPRRLSDLVVWGAPAWSPDGSRIVFESRKGPGSRADIWSVAPSGAGLKRLTRGSDVPAEDTAPAWSAETCGPGRDWRGR